jgi:outer membrane biogenesis lipoprotein LolB
MSRVVVLTLLAVLLAGCTTPAQRKAAEDADVRKQATQKIKRICSLPEAEREAELKRIKDQSGVVIIC